VGVVANTAPVRVSFVADISDPPFAGSDPASALVRPGEIVRILTGSATTTSRRSGVWPTHQRGRDEMRSHQCGGLNTYQNAYVDDYDGFRGGAIPVGHEPDHGQSRLHAVAQ
jgi:hypothetical protein